MTSRQSSLSACSENSSPILLDTVLQLLSERLKKLSYSGFFATELDQYVNQLRESVKLLQQQLSETPLEAPVYRGH